MHSSYDKNSPETIRSLFNAIAESYDRGNWLISFGLHALWNRRFAKRALKGRPKPQAILDLCAGTGEIALRLHSLLKESDICYTLADFSPHMLKIAHSRTTKFPQEEQQRFRFVEADAAKLPFSADSFDLATIAYGVRNVKDLHAMFSELHRVLRPGAAVAILELTRPKYSLLEKLHSLYLQRALPLIGALSSHNQSAYEYLSKSIHEFVKPEAISELMHDAGFTDVQIERIAGGIATRIIASKPITTLI